MKLKESLFFYYNSSIHVLGLKIISGELLRYDTLCKSTLRRVDANPSVLRTYIYRNYFSYFYPRNIFWRPPAHNANLSVSYIFPELSSSRRDAASFLPTVRLIELWMVFLILRGVDAMLMSSCRMWLYTSSWNVKSAGIWLLKTMVLIRCLAIEIETVKKKKIQTVFKFPSKML